VKTACALAASALAALATAAGAAAAPARFDLGIQDFETFQGNLSPDERAVALTHAHEAGASIIRLSLSWRDIDTRDPGTRANATNPDWAGYRWAEYDREIRAVVAAGMQPMLVVIDAPAWFEGAPRPGYDTAPVGTWSPNPRAYADFARAAAQRYSGSHSDGNGRLPRVRWFQAWNEPNLTEYLAPQVRSGGAYSPVLYRSLLNAFYASVKAVRRDNFVVAAGLAPFGDYPARSGGRTPPLYFARKLLCVNDSYTSARRCPRVHFDAFAAHAFPDADPRETPLNRDDVRLRLTGIVRALKLAAKAGTITSAQAGRIWMTEVSWNGGAYETFPLAQQAEFMQIAFYMLWAEGVDAALWYNIRDRAQVEFTYRAGLFTRGATVQDDTPKPAFTAFRFPFVALRSGSRRFAWGRAPSAHGTVAIEQDDGKGGWRRVASFPASSGRVFTRSLPRSGQPLFRARQGSLGSLPFGVTTATP
jgi:hypothetical protein